MYKTGKADFKQKGQNLTKLDINPTRAFLLCFSSNYVAIFHVFFIGTGTFSQHYIHYRCMKLISIIILLLVKVKTFFTSLAQNLDTNGYFSIANVAKSFRRKILKKLFTSILLCKYDNPLTT